ncbi:hypothetical protein E1091_00170 [Micromonospora fluostatini]|uniref:MarR family transcriptional regulator n=1 Tax=Micromonospora fluostatini TaxID=1629071 RepID=A0ABY2DM83_9ACTN|nr:hypothetical protein E1091_00170 [Micromonospora fluostatini]
MSGDSLEQFQRDFAAMHELVAKLEPDDAAGLARVREFLENQRAVPAAHLARAAADLYYLQGHTVEALAAHLGRNKQAVSEVLRSANAPTQYLAVRRDPDIESYETRWVPVTVTLASKRELAAMREQGWRIAPAAWQVAPDAVRPAELWERLGEVEG